MSLNRRLKRAKERYGKQLFDLVGHYVYESKGKGDSDREMLFYSYRNKWVALCHKGNKEEVGITFQPEAFSIMVKQNYKSLYLNLFPDTPLKEKLMLNLKKVVYA